MPRPTLPIRLAALLALLGVLLAACGGAATPAAQPTAAGAGATAAPAEQPTAAPATGATAAPAEQATTAPAADAEVSLQETLIHAGDFTDQILYGPSRRLRVRRHPGRRQRLSDAGDDPLRAGAARSSRSWRRSGTSKTTAIPGR